VCATSVTSYTCAGCTSMSLEIWDAAGGGTQLCEITGITASGYYEGTGSAWVASTLDQVQIRVKRIGGLAAGRITCDGILCVGK